MSFGTRAETDLDYKKRGKPSPWAQPPASSPQPLLLGGKKVYKKKLFLNFQNQINFAP